MNGPTTSIIGSIGLALAGVVVGWLASHNIIPAADVTADTALIGTGIVGAIGAGIVWFKAHTSTTTAKIQSINTEDNGVKVVSAASPSPPVSEPLK